MDTTSQISDSKALIFTSVTSLHDADHLTKEGRLVELRVDLCSLKDLQELLHRPYLPWLLTLRSIAHGGAFTGSLHEQRSLIQRLANKAPFCMDLEYDLRELISSYPHIRWILSYHALLLSLQDIHVLYQAMHKYSAWRYKIATTCHTVTEAITLMRKKPIDLSLICMGAAYTFTRIWALTMPGMLHFVKHNTETALGQLSWEDLALYQHIFEKPHTKLYGLIGDPILKSPGHLYHNKLFADRHLDALYVKIPLPSKELASFLIEALALPFYGLSVTMPLKEEITKYIPSTYGALNTLVYKQGHFIGYNTDGLGALYAIQEHLLPRQIVILGTGGTAKALGYMAIEQGIEVFFVSRDKKRAKALAKDFMCQGGTIDEAPPHYDVIINTSPEFPAYLTSYTMHQNAFAMDVVHTPKMTPFLQNAERQGCKLIFGEVMFRHQAQLQRLLWNV